MHAGNPAGPLGTSIPGIAGMAGAAAPFDRPVPTYACLRGRVFPRERGAEPPDWFIIASKGFRFIGPVDGVDGLAAAGVSASDGVPKGVAAVSLVVGSAMVARGSRTR